MQMRSADGEQQQALVVELRSVLLMNLAGKRETL